METAAETETLDLGEANIQSNTSGKKAFLFYPPGPVYQRGEDRSQGNVSDSAATVMRAPNDMAYASAILKELGCKVEFTDFPTENKSYNDLIDSFERAMPDIVLASVTNSTIFSDIETINELKKLNPNALFVLKGALFFDGPHQVIEGLDLTNVDYLIGGEIEFSIGPLVQAHFNDASLIPTVPGIMYKNNERKWVKGTFGSWNKNIDDIPFPDRSVIRNELYIRPDTGEAQATIATSRGCPAACTYCLTPVISGKKVRFRDPEQILEELKECYYDYGIRNFFFKSDTFTIDHSWVEKLCSAITSSELHGKIQWVANSRVRPLKDTTLELMKEAGCWLVAFGFESGSPETLKGVKKGASIDDNLRAAKLAKAAGLKLYGFYLIGLPWESEAHLKATERHIFKIDADFIEVHVALPYFGTELYQQALYAGTLNENIMGADYFHASSKGTKHLSSDQLVDFRRKLILRYHLRPRYIFRKLKESAKSWRVLKSYFLFGSRLLITSLTSSRR